MMYLLRTAHLNLADLEDAQGSPLTSVNWLELPFIHHARDRIDMGLDDVERPLSQQASLSLCRGAWSKQMQCRPPDGLQHGCRLIAKCPGSS